MEEGRGHSFTFYFYLLGEISELGDAELPAVALSVVLLNLSKIVLEMVEPHLLLGRTLVSLAVETLEPGKLHSRVQTGCQAGR